MDPNQMNQNGLYDLSFLRKILFYNNFMRCLKCTDRHLWATPKYTVVLNMLSQNYMYIFCSNYPGAIINQRRLVICKFTTYVLEPDTYFKWSIGDLNLLQKGVWLNINAYEEIYSGSDKSQPGCLFLDHIWNLMCVV